MTTRESRLHDLAPSFRVLVTRADQRSIQKGFVWKIVHAGLDGDTTRETSTRSFSTMQEAYTAGTAALTRFQG